MSEIAHIIVGMDAQGLADQAVVASIRLSQLLSARLDIIHAVSPRHPDWFFEDERHAAKVLAEITIHARAAMTDRLHSLLAANGDERAHDDDLHVVGGSPAGVLSERAEAHGSLLVVGRHEDRGMFDFGGTTRELLRDMRFPVWLQKNEWSDIRKILVPVDLTPGGAAVFEMAAWLADEIGAEFEVLYCFEEPRSSYGWQPTFAVRDYRRAASTNLDQFLARVAEGRQKPVPRRVVDGDPAHAILGCEDSVDLIVMGSHGHSPFVQAMLGSQAYRVLRLAELPVLVVPQRRIKSLEDGSQ